MSKRPRVSLASIIAETGRRAASPEIEIGQVPDPVIAPVETGLATLTARHIPAAPPVPSAPIEIVAPAASCAMPETACLVEPPPPVPATATVEQFAAPAPFVPAPAAMPAASGVEAAPSAPKKDGVISLSPILDLKAAAPLRAELMAARGRPVELDASKVQRLGALCLQVILSAHRTWSTEGTPIRILSPSPEFRDGVAVFGGGDLLAA